MILTISPPPSPSHPTTTMIAVIVVLTLVSCTVTGYYAYHYGASDPDRYRDGQEDQYASDYADGYADGFADGNSTGGSDGFNDGRYDGYNDGFGDSENQRTAVSRDISPVLDGDLDDSEWQYASWFGVVYRADEPDGGNGYEYLLIGENTSTFFIGLDLCSSRDGGDRPKWIGCSLQTMPSSPFNSSTFATARNTTVDTWFYNVSSNSICVPSDFAGADQIIGGNSTLNGVTISTAFGKSHRSNIDHWMVEIAIPQSSFHTSRSVNASMNVVIGWCSPFYTAFPYTFSTATFFGVGYCDPTDAQWYYPLPLSTPRVFYI